MSHIVDCELLRDDLARAVPRSDGSKGGRPPFDLVVMFKVLILQASHSLSDERDPILIEGRLSFMRFLGLGLSDPVPDAKTTWAFREALTRAEIARHPAIEVLFSAYPSLSGATDGNQIKLLATNGAQRSAQAPNLPSLAEFIPGFDFAPVIGIFAHSGTPPAVVQKIAAEAVAVAGEPDLISRLAVVGVESAGAGPEGFGSVLQAETRRVAETVQAAGIKAR